MIILKNEYISKLLKKEIGKNEFLHLINCSSGNLLETVDKCFEYAIEKKDSEQVEFCIIVIRVFELELSHFTLIFNILILEDWHYKHEDIARFLQQIKSETSVIPLSKAIFSLPKYLLKYGELNEYYPFEIKCIWALYSIGNKQAIEIIKTLTNHSNKIIAECAQERIAAFEK